MNNNGKWYVVYTHPLKEGLAKTELLQQEFDVFLPLYQTTVRHARKITTVEKPLFPRYMFVRIDIDNHQWRSVNGTRGVVSLMTQNNKPVSVRDTIIDILQAEQGDSGVLTLKALNHFAPGSKVRFIDGAFEGYDAIVQKMFDDKTRVQLLLSFLGRETSVSAPLMDIEAA